MQANHFAFLSKNPPKNNGRFLPMCKKVNLRNKNRDFSVPLLVQTLICGLGRAH